MRRETFGTIVECKSCGRSGTAKLSEFENPVWARNELDTRPEETPKGFDVKGRQIVCKGCKAVVWPSA